MNKASGGDGIPAELFQILKDDAVKSAAINMPTNLQNSAVPTRLENVSFHSNPKEFQRMFKYHTIALIGYTRKAMLKIFPVKLQ